SLSELGRRGRGFVEEVSSDLGPWFAHSRAVVLSNGIRTIRTSASSFSPFQSLPPLALREYPQPLGSLGAYPRPRRSRLSLARLHCGRFILLSLFHRTGSQPLRNAFRVVTRCAPAQT